MPISRTDDRDARSIETTSELAAPIGSAGRGGRLGSSRRRPRFSDVTSRAALTALAATIAAGSLALHAQVTSDRLVRAADEPQNWLTYSGGYASQRYSLLKQIEPGNVKNLELKWILPNQVFGAWQSTPLVVDGIMYVTQRPNDVLAVDAKTGRVFWQYRYAVSPDARVCCGSNNRGVAILGDTLFMGTLDAHLVALDARTGRPLWNVAVGDPKPRLLDHDGAARRQGQGARRRRRRRVRHPRLHRRLRREDGQGSSGASTRFRDPASRVTRPGAATPGRPAADRSG